MKGYYPVLVLHYVQTKQHAEPHVYRGFLICWQQFYSVFNKNKPVKEISNVQDCRTFHIAGRSCPSI